MGKQADIGDNGDAKGGFGMGLLPSLQQATLVECIETILKGV